MAILSAAIQWEVRADGSDTLNGGGFDPSKTSGMFTDGAATSATSTAPVFTSASYAFVAGDVGAWLFIGAGSNWRIGWYQITSVSAGAATINATAGAWVDYSGASVGNRQVMYPGVNTGCATAASPTGATWSVDYSQEATARIAFTDLASTGAGLTVSSAGNPIGKQHVGNVIVVTGGTNFTTGRYCIISVAAGVATVDGAANITTGAGTGGTGGLGGALLNVTATTAPMATAGNGVWVRSGTYTLNAGWVAGIRCAMIGYATVRGDCPTGDNRPLLNANANGLTLYSNGANIECQLAHLRLSANGKTSITGVSFGNSRNAGAWIKVTGATTGFTVSAAYCTYSYCEADSCATGFSGTLTLSYCRAVSCTSNGFATSSGALINCIAHSCATGFNAGGTIFFHCTAYNNTSHGFTNGNPGSHFINCIATNNGGYGYNIGTAVSLRFDNCYGLSNTSGLILSATPLTGGAQGPLYAPAPANLSANPFVDAANGDFRLNDTPGGGGLLRAAGYPSAFPGLPLTANFADIGAVQASPSRSGWGL